MVHLYLQYRLYPDKTLTTLPIHTLDRLVSQLSRRLLRNHDLRHRETRATTRLIHLFDQPVPLELELNDVEAEGRTAEADCSPYEG